MQSNIHPSSSQEQNRKAHNTVTFFALREQEQVYLIESTFPPLPQTPNKPSNPMAEAPNFSAPQDGWNTDRQTSKQTNKILSAQTNNFFQVLPPNFFFADCCDQGEVSSEESNQTARERHREKNPK
jgi:hypothetical protein